MFQKMYIFFNSGKTVDTEKCSRISEIGKARITVDKLLEKKKKLCRPA